LVVVDIEALAHAIDAELQAGSTPERAAKERAYLKSKLHHYGTSVPATRAVAKATARRHPQLTHDQLDALVNALWAVPVHERRMAAVELLELYCDRLDPEDAALLERLLRESRTWALVDGLAASVVGRLVEQYPELGAVLDRWAANGDLLAASVGNARPAHPPSGGPRRLRPLRPLRRRHAVRARVLHPQSHRLGAA
jgi:3-methyladenine DNA glycosylase AlkD